MNFVWNLSNGVYASIQNSNFFDFSSKLNEAASFYASNEFFFLYEIFSKASCFFLVFELFFSNVLDFF